MDQMEEEFLEIDKKEEDLKAVKREVARLNKLFKKLPQNKFKLAQGLIQQAARLRVRLDRLWVDIVETGETELFSQSDKTEPYERERPSARLFTATDKNYQSVMKQLFDLLPPEETEVNELAEFLKHNE